jgi:hypothetical protein
MVITWWVRVYQNIRRRYKIQLDLSGISCHASRSAGNLPVSGVLFFTMEKGSAGSPPGTSTSNSQFHAGNKKTGTADRPSRFERNQF